MVDAAIGDVSHRFGSLRRASEELPIADRESLKTIVTSLVQSAKEMEEANRRLESNLRISKQQIGNLQQDLKKASSEALTDPLTSLGNRMLFDRELSRLIRQSSVPDGQVSLLMADIDHFKNINDSYGHQIGDQVIRLVAANIQKHLKGGDIGTRYGGEEFAVILDRTGLSEAFSIAEQIRRSVSVREFRKRTTGESMGRITISVGVASMQLGDTPQSLTDRADKCLYEAKRSGRNCVICSIKNTPVSL
jgi:diguanylate cyclase